MRLFAYGLVSVILVLYLTRLGLSEPEVGLLLTLTLIGDTAISLWLTTIADRVGRRRMLLAGAGLMLFAGVVFALTKNYLLLVAAATIGVISPSGYEVGPFLAIEQAALSQTIAGGERTRVFARYNLVGSFATAVGSLCGGGLAQALQQHGLPALASYRVIVIAYALIGVTLALLFSRLSPGSEPEPATSAPAAEAAPKPWLGLHRSRRVVFRLAGLFSIDAFAGGLVIQSMIAYWFHVRFGVNPGILGGIFFGANLLAGVSALTASRIAAKIGLINTMVFTHLPSNVLLILVPLMPTLPLAIVMLLLRFSISQMDVPTRQSYTMAVVSPDERSAAAGVTNVARSTGASLSPAITGRLLASASLASVPFFASGALKIVYDLLLYRNFRRLKTPWEEKPGK